MPCKCFIIGYEFTAENGRSQKFSVQTNVFSFITYFVSIIMRKFRFRPQMCQSNGEGENSEGILLSRNLTRWKHYCPIRENCCMHLHPFISKFYQELTLWPEWQVYLIFLNLLNLSKCSIVSAAQSNHTASKSRYCFRLNLSKVLWLL